jgi:hypothetical protein
LWAGTFDERLTDVFSVQDSISPRVAGALTLELTEAQRSLLTRRDTSDSEAYQLYLRGRFFWNKRSRNGFERGVAYFRLLPLRVAQAAMPLARAAAGSHLAAPAPHAQSPRVSVRACLPQRGDRGGPWNSDQEGCTLGRKVGRFVVKNFFPPHGRP